MEELKKQENAILACANTLGDAVQALSDALDLLESAKRRSPRWADGFLDAEWIDSAREALADGRAAMEARRQADCALIAAIRANPIARADLAMAQLCDSLIAVPGKTS